MEGPGFESRRGRAFPSVDRFRGSGIRFKALRDGCPGLSLTLMRGLGFHQDIRSRQARFGGPVVFLGRTVRTVNIGEAIGGVLAARRA